MKMSCRICRRPVTVSLVTWLGGGPVFCPPDEQGTCIGVFVALHESPPDEDPEPDPDSVPPEDIDECPPCKGSGEVFTRRDWATGAYEYDTCRACGGSGEVTPSWLAPESMR